MKVLQNVLETIGATPLVRLQKTEPRNGAAIYGKLEFLNPGGSVKDRIALGMVESLERSGMLKPDGTLVEASSGNMGIGLAMVAAQKGYRCIIVMTDKTSEERRQIIQAFGAEVVMTSIQAKPDEPEFYLNLAQSIANEIPGSVLIDQFFNKANPQTHYETTAQEIWMQMQGEIDAFIGGIGTGGTLSGVAKFLKEKNSQIRIIAADPIGSILKQFHETGQTSEGKIYKVEGIGEDFVPETLHLRYVDTIIEVDDKTSFAAARELTRTEGIFCGGSSGTIITVAKQISQDLGKGKNVICIIPDTGERYLSKMYSDRWLKTHNLQ